MALRQTNYQEGTLLIEIIGKQLYEAGYILELSRFKEGWLCQLANKKLGTYPSGCGVSILESIESAVDHASHVILHRGVRNESRSA